MNSSLVPAEKMRCRFSTELFFLWENSSFVLSNVFHWSMSALALLLCQRGLPLLEPLKQKRMGIGMEAGDRVCCSKYSIFGHLRWTQEYQSYEREGWSDIVWYCARTPAVSPFDLTVKKHPLISVVENQIRAIDNPCSKSNVKPETVWAAY